MLEGETMINFFVPGDPVAQGRPRAFRVGNSIGMFDPKKSKEWKKTVAQVAGLQRNRFQEGLLEMRLAFFLVPPKTMKRPDLMFHSKRPDLDNLCKAICDALNGICFKDDSQICKLTAVKSYTVNNLAGVEIFIGPIS
jgi:Holliday junction resolvase RusA-like endonuclease